MASDADFLLYLDKRADKSMISDPAAIQIYRLDNRHLLAEYNVGGNTGLFEISAHIGWEMGSLMTVGSWLPGGGIFHNCLAVE